MDQFGSRPLVLSGRLTAGAGLTLFSSSGSHWQAATLLVILAAGAAAFLMADLQLKINELVRLKYF